MTSSASSLNIACSCTACTFLQPFPPSHMTSISTPNNEVERMSTKNTSKRVRPALSIWTSPSSMHSRSMSTSSLPSYVSSSPDNVESCMEPFPRTPGLRRCTHITCSERIALPDSLSQRTRLCQRHGKELRHSVRQMMFRPWAASSCARKVSVLGEGETVLEEERNTSEQGTDKRVDVRTMGQQRKGWARVEWW